MGPMPTRVPAGHLLHLLHADRCRPAVCGRALPVAVALPGDHRGSGGCVSDTPTLPPSSPNSWWSALPSPSLCSQATSSSRQVTIHTCSCLRRTRRMCRWSKWEPPATVGGALVDRPRLRVKWAGPGSGKARGSGSVGAGPTPLPPPLLSWTASLLSASNDWLWVPGRPVLSQQNSRRAGPGVIVPPSPTVLHPPSSSSAHTHSFLPKRAVGVGVGLVHRNAHLSTSRVPKALFRSPTVPSPREVGGSPVPVQDHHRLAAIQ